MNPTLDTELAASAHRGTRTEHAELAETIIDSRASRLSISLRELWVYRELLGFLVWRDVKVRYKQTALGAAWAILQPLLAMMVFTLLFGRLAKLPSDNIPYPLFVYVALLPWQLFAFALTESSNSLVNNQHLIRKVYFPRLVVPVAAVLVGLVDFVISLIVLAGMMIYYGFLPGPAAILFIPFLALAVLTALGIGIWLSALNIQYRDVKYVVPFLTQFWMFATPVAYSASLVPPQWRVLYSLNPMTGVVNGFRWSLLGAGGDVTLMIPISAAVVLVILFGGIAWFKKMERSFADVV